MRSRSQKIRRRHGGFQPPFCPNRGCSFHKPDPSWHFIRYGKYCPQPGYPPCQVFKCNHCGRRFTARTFSTSYWLHRRDLLRKVAQLTAEGPGLRQMARFLGTSHATIMRHIARLGRHCLLFHESMTRDQMISEKLVIDGFETFEYSQYYPFHINLAVGADSWFVHNFTDSPLRRKGAMTPEQKRRRQEQEIEYGKADPKAVENGIYGLLCPLIRRIRGGHLVLHSDDHKAYPRALQRLSRNENALRSIDHKITSSKARRTTSNPLFPANLTDLRLRHGSANHRRETIAFSKRRQGAMERVAISAVSHNSIKKRSENGPLKSSAKQLGLTDRLLDWRTVLRWRLFPEHFDLSKEWATYYWRRVRTVVFGDCQTVNNCRYAF